MCDFRCECFICFPDITFTLTQWQRRTNGRLPLHLQCLFFVCCFCSLRYFLFSRCFFFSSFRWRTLQIRALFVFILVDSNNNNHHMPTVLSVCQCVSVYCTGENIAIASVAIGVSTNRIIKQITPRDTLNKINKIKKKLKKRKNRFCSSSRMATATSSIILLFNKSNTNCVCCVTKCISQVQWKEIQFEWIIKMNN